MTIHEFSDAFDVALSSYQSTPEYTEQFANTEIVLNEYEKSLFLTRAQEEVVKTIYNGLPLSDSFEKTETARRQLDALVKFIMMLLNKTQDYMISSIITLLSFLKIVGTLSLSRLLL